MEKDILELLKSMNDKINTLSEGQNRIENKVNSIVQQTADLTEFKSETKESLLNINNAITELRKDFSTVEIVTASNYLYISKLKAVK